MMASQTIGEQELAANNNPVVSLYRDGVYETVRSRSHIRSETAVQRTIGIQARQMAGCNAVGIGKFATDDNRVVVLNRQSTERGQPRTCVRR